MARLNDEKRELILADWHTGRYSHSQLGKKYNTSHVTIGKLVGGITPKHADKVTAQIAINTALSQESYKEVTAFNEAVTEATKHLHFLNNATLKNISTMVKKLDSKTTIQEHKFAQDAIDKAAITLKVADRHAPKQDIKVENNHQNNIIEVVYE